MKTRRLTVVCMAAIALVGTPRAWQEIGNLLEVAQQKAQMKFWSMVMRPAGPAEVELIAAEEAAPAHFVSPCPDENSWENLEAVSYREPRRATTPAPSRQRATARRQRAEAGTQALIAHALKAPAVKESVERALQLEGLKDADFEFSEVAETVPAPQPACRVKAVPQPRATPADTLSFVQLPPMAPVATAFSEKEVTYQFKLLKKTLNENKLLLRQRGRLPAVRVSTSFPAS
jgi:hypothetical protein